MKIKDIILIFISAILIFNLTIKNLYAEIPLYTLNAIKLTYKDNNKIIIAEGKANAKDQFGKEIYSDFIIYDKVNNTIKTKSNSKYKDKQGNEIDADDFFYDLNIKKIKAINNVKYKEKQGNIFLFSEFEYFENSNKGFGKNLKGLLTDKSSFESRFAEIDNNLGIITIKTDTKKINLFNKFKSLFNNNENRYTTCENFGDKKNIKEQCPDWSLSTYQTTQDSKKKMVYHEHAVLKIKNIPVFYTPYFSHPDPTVKRKSGLLPASTKNFSNLGRTFKVPYFWAINDNSDLTFTPIFYQDENSIYLTEYRKQDPNYKMHLDTSYSKGYQKLNKTSDNGQLINRTGGSRNHFFLNINSNYNNLILDHDDIEIKIQRVSQKNYLNVNQINTDLIKQDLSNLQNSIIINSYRNNEKLKIYSSVYENLNVDNPSTKYQYKIPYIEYTNFLKKFGHNLSLSSLFEANNYNGDTKKIIQRNTLELNSQQKILKKLGLSNIFKYKISNTNNYNEKVENSKPNLNNDLNATIAMDTSIPLIKYSNNIEQTLSPKIFTKYTSGSMNNQSTQNKILAYNDIYSIDRLNNIEKPETGASAGYGVDYTLNKKSYNNANYLTSKFSIGQVLTDVDKNKMPSNSSLNKKSSNFVGNFNFLLNKAIYENQLTNKTDKFSIDYNFNISKDLNKILQNDISLNYSNKKNSLTASYYELNEIGNNHYVDAKYQRFFQNNLNLMLGLRKNLELNYSESNFIEVNYESDCLKVGLNLSKQFYENDDIQKSNNLTFFIMLKPFGQPIAPDLSNLFSN